MRKPRILVVTSCTQSKQDRAMKAQSMYVGMQHAKLMVGVLHARSRGIDVDLRIISAGYGLISGDKRIEPYNQTFSGLGKREIEEAAYELDIPEDMSWLLATPYDLALIMLGTDYLIAAGIAGQDVLASPTIALASRSSIQYLPDPDYQEEMAINIVELGVADTRKFGAGFVALKGEIAMRLLLAIADVPDALGFLQSPDSDPLWLAERVTE